MQLTQFTDYALRTLIYMATKTDLCTVTEIADSYKISRHHLVKVVHKLGSLGYIITIRGNKGGIKLSASPEQINVGEVVQKTEPHFHLVECLDEANGTCCIIPVCRLKKILVTAQQDFIRTLCQFTLADITQNPEELGMHLKIPVSAIGRRTSNQS